MPSYSFWGCSDYVESFWNATDGAVIVGKVYQHPVTEADAAKYSSLKVGQTVHMMAHHAHARGVRHVRGEHYVITEAVSDDIDDTALNTKVAELLTAGALHVDSDRHSIVVRTYEDLVESWGLTTLVDDPNWDEIQRIGQTHYQKKHMRELNEYFVANSRVFTAEELVIIDNYRKASAAYYQLFKGDKS
jgi:hypothetical protein